VGGYSYHNAYHWANGPLGSDRLGNGGTTPTDYLLPTKRGLKSACGEEERWGDGTWQQELSALSVVERVR
jgi:hypothetical protein